MPLIKFFSLTPSSPLALPPHIQRTYISTPSGQLELLVAEPTSSSSSARKSPTFFAHGGCGAAAVWLEYMTFFSQKHGIPCYAVSCRGRGASWYPSFLRLYFTTKRMLADDLVAGIRYVEDLENEKARGGEKVQLVLVGHSSGGGLSQLILNAGDVSVQGLALLGAIPGYGSYRVNLNWLRLDPWFNLRMFFHFGHPMSPLSFTALVKQAFFCSAYPDSKVREFETRMPHSESFLWPLGMLFRFVDFRNVVRGISGWGGNRFLSNSGQAMGQHRILVLAGGEDKLVSPDLCLRLASEIRGAYSELVAEKKIEASNTEKEREVKETSPEVETEGQGVWYRRVPGAGHHFQNDLQWEEGAGKLLEWYEQL
ncbi:alpha/beta-hydrolase [Aulographum hederae CBS 113979]|uniref:Alpha/beta-hydrolase n=1 Tax=Aulographum hederae CBS 113979 TaxID=1176131 RepID=A0A6G1GMZ5_9PEZI|nr:alpha/beta-hydrolase [Aulographum hederae CBS 113979]